MPFHLPKPLLTTQPFPPEEEALLRRCLESPWDDAPILIYADWVQENDEDQRAEFIRTNLQEGVACHSPPAEVEHWLENHLPERDWLFVRGLPVWLVESDLPYLEEAVFEWSTPRRRQADLAFLTSIARHIRVAFRSGWPVGLSLYQNLPVDEPFGNAGVKLFARMQELEHVGVLRLNNLEIGEYGIRKLATSPYLKNLWYLRLADAGEGTVEGELLRNSDELERLRIIDAPDSDDTQDEAEWRDS